MCDPLIFDMIKSEAILLILISSNDIILFYFIPLDKTILRFLPILSYETCYSNLGWSNLLMIFICEDEFLKLLLVD